MNATPAKLALEDGTVYTGRAFGATGETAGEVVFNTSLTGYQEILTDPSYKGQLVTMTYPQIGNYGITEEDSESARPQVDAFIVREYCRRPSNFRSTSGLHEYLQQHGIIGLEGIDTRSLVRHIRSQGAMRGVLSHVDLDDHSLVEKARSSVAMLGRDLVSSVVPEQAGTWSEGCTSEFTQDILPSAAESRHVVALDFGMKWHIPRYLVQSGCRVTILPGTASAEEVLAREPDGIFLSNGPGDPAAVPYAVAMIKDLIGKKPMFGICLGHQLLGLALGARTFKLKFGHRGANQPVLNSKTECVEITTQNHGFAVDATSLPSDVEATHWNLNDDTLEGLRHRELPLFSVQYHPESSAGPHDSVYLFEEFTDLIDRHR